MTDPRIRVLKIKTGVVKRLTKEKTCYEKETEQQRERVQKYKDEGSNNLVLTFLKLVTYST